MSSLTLTETRVLCPDTIIGTRYETIAAEWFKTWPGNPMQYRVTGGGPVLYYASAQEATRAAARRVARIRRGTK